MRHSTKQKYIDAGIIAFMVSVMLIGLANCVGHARADEPKAEIELKLDSVQSAPASVEKPVTFTHDLTALHTLCAGKTKKYYCGCATNFRRIVAYRIEWLDESLEPRVVKFDPPLEGDETTLGGYYTTCHKLMGYSNLDVRGSALIMRAKTFQITGYK